VQIRVIFGVKVATKRGKWDGEEYLFGCLGVSKCNCRYTLDYIGVLFVTRKVRTSV